MGQVAAQNFEHGPCKSFTALEIVLLHRHLKVVLHF
jgi:hypothetical protein